MSPDILDPLSEYINVFHHRFKEVADSTFAELANVANVDIAANQETCRKLYDTEGKLSDVTKTYHRWKICCVLSWIVIVIGAAVVLLSPLTFQLETGVIIIISLIAAFCAVFLYTEVYPRLKEMADNRSQLETSLNKLKSEAWQQMSPLNELYDWDVLTRMMSKTVPKLEFDPYFTTQRLADLKRTYGWDDKFSAERSVIYSHSGLINGNPFVICRTRIMKMSMKVYTGSKTIYWTTVERDSEGKRHTVHHSETLTAEVSAPYPTYPEATRLIYGNTAAPDLIFYRMPNNLAGKENTLSFKWNRHLLRKKARNLSNADFAMMTNEEFEVAFNTSNRNNNQQFALLFTPLAQENMLKLLKDTETGFGDDFSFSKTKMINTIVSSHMQTLNLDLDPRQYHHFDYEKAKANFYSINARYFRSIYFCFAPLLCVPMYQQIRPHSAIYGKDMPRRSSFWEHEALANFWGEKYFKHPQCVTNCILKTMQRGTSGNRSEITVFAHGYRSEQRLTYVEKWGGDGRTHDVPVYWDEYLPVTGQGKIDMAEDNIDGDNDMACHQRINHINEILSKSKMSYYRRHIASRISRN